MIGTVDCIEVQQSHNHKQEYNEYSVTEMVLLTSISIIMILVTIYKIIVGDKDTKPRNSHLSESDLGIYEYRD